MANVISQAILGIVRKLNLVYTRSANTYYGRWELYSVTSMLEKIIEKWMDYEANRMAHENLMENSNLLMKWRIMG